MRIVGDNELIIQDQYEILNYVDGSRMSEVDEQKVRDAIEELCNELILRSRLKYTDE